MNTPYKVVWSEGMFLSPHHFQQWDRYHESLVVERTKMVSPFAWGVSELDIDPDGLANGHCSVLRLRAVMPDGLALNVPEVDRAPETISFADLFSPGMEHLGVFLGVPVERSGAPNVQLGETRSPRPVRFTAESVKVGDDNTGDNAREIMVARRSVRLFVAGQDMTDHVTMKIAELVRTPGGSVALREHYVPPALAISASPYLVRMARSLLELMTAKAGALAAQRADAGAFDPGKWLALHTLNGALPELAHVAHTGRAHPEVLYVALARLAGELASVSSDGVPKDIPPYSHAELAQVFRLLEMKIRAALDTATPVRHTVIPLEVTRENLWVAKVVDERVLATSQLYVMAGEASEEQLRDGVPRRVKVGAVTDVELIVTAALPGVRMYHLPRAPGTVPAKPGYQCFRLENQGDFWESVCRSRSIAFYVPSDLRGVKLELVAVKE